MTKFLIFFALLWSSFSIGQAIWMTPNQGQWNSQIDYAVDLAQGKLYLEEDGMCFFLTDVMTHEHEHEHEHEELHSEIRYHAIKQHFIGSNITTNNGEGKSAHYKNYILGNNPSSWKRKVYSFNEVTYPNFYDGIDLIYIGQRGQLSYNFRIQPETNTDLIAFNFDGAESVSIKEGNLIIGHRFGTISQSKPKAWEIDENGNKKQKISVEYVIHNDIVSFHFPDGYDVSKSIFIDP